MKKVLITLACLPVLWFALAAFMPSKAVISRNLDIMAPAEDVFTQFNNLHHWKNWSYWDQADPKMQSSYAGPEAGVGSSHTWTSESMGNGTLTIVESTPPTGIKYQLQIDGMEPAWGNISLMGRGNDLQVTMGLEMPLPLWGRPLGPFMDQLMGPDFEASLKGLKATCEKTN
ncbi:MAG: SRPBCC family protein [Bacteroidia bacterium]